MRGQVYVPVEADATTPMLMNVAGSGVSTEGVVAGGYLISWQNPGGVSGIGLTGGDGWPNGYVPSLDTPKEEINLQIKTRWEALLPEERKKLFWSWGSACIDIQ